MFTVSLVIDNAPLQTKQSTASISGFERPPYEFQCVLSDQIRLDATKSLRIDDNVIG